MSRQPALWAPRSEPVHNRWLSAYRLLPALALLAGMLLPIVSGARAAAPQHEPALTRSAVIPTPEYAQSLMAKFGLATLRPAQTETELEDLPVYAITSDLSPNFVMRSRPFVLTEQSIDAFPNHQAKPGPMTESHARARLKRFLYRRGLSGDEVNEAVALYDDETVKAIIPAPTLRAAMLMLYKWDPYQATIDSILNGVNPSGVAFASVDYGDTNFQDAVATLKINPNGQFRLIVDNAFDREPPEEIIPVIFHESLHGGGTNSRQEEVTANILDIICYAEVLLVDSRVAEFGTELGFFNNIVVLGLLNSMGRAGGDEVGILSSPLGDIFVGPSFERSDVSSIRAVVEGDDFYGSLPGTGSTAVPAFYTVMNRFPDTPSLGENFGYGEAELAVIDRDAGTVLTPKRVRDLAITLGLGMTGAVTESTLPGTEPTSLADRPYQPFNPGDYDLREAKPQARPLTIDESKSKLRSALKRAGASAAERSRLAALFDDPDLGARVPDPTLRAAVLLLGISDPWRASLDGITGGDPTATLLSVDFANFSNDRLVALVPSQASGGEQIQINSVLIGEPIEVLASYVVEGSILSTGDITRGEAVSARLMGTLWYGSVLLDRPGLSSRRSWGTIERNRDLLALVNSSESTDNNPANAASFGFLAPANGASDCLPGLYDDADSFAQFVLSELGTGYDDGTNLSPRTSISERYLDFAGVQATGNGTNGAMFNTENLLALDANLGTFLTDDQVLAIVTAMGLRIAIAG